MLPGSLHPHVKFFGKLPMETPLPQTILPMENFHPQKMLQKYFPVINTICEQWANFVDYSPFSRDYGGSCHTQKHNYGIFQAWWNITIYVASIKVPSMVKYFEYVYLKIFIRCFLGKGGVRGGLVALQYFDLFIFDQIGPLPISLDHWFGTITPVKINEYAHIHDLSSGSQCKVPQFCK